jgi:hypothetical protein
VERFCTPSEKLCDGERSMVCNATGDGLDFVEDCAAASQSCVGAGVCKPKICHEGDLVCANGSVERCGMKGTAYGLFVLCDPTTQVCDDSSGSAQCVFACTPNAPVCDGNVLTTCAIDGKALNAGGVDCTATGEVCDPVSSACAPKTCEPHSTYCKNGNVYACVASGSTEMLFQACKASEYCREYPTQAAYCETDVCYAGQMTCTGSIARPCLADGSGFDFTTGTDCSTQDAQCYVNQCSPCGSTAHPANNYCVRDVCPQGAVTCNDNRIVTCKADGTGFNLVGTDCAMLGEICDQNRQCAMAAVDTIGTWINSNYDQQALVGNVYRVDSARHLTQIEMDIETPGSNPLAWVVYESSDGGQSFTKIAETTTLIVDPSIGLVNSGPISVPLVKGDYYTIGMYSPVAARLGQPQDFSSNLEMTSFGQVVGDRFWYYNENALTGYNSSARYFQQLTTVP